MAVQGFGNVGRHAALLTPSFGCKVVAVSDSKGGVFSKAGLEPEVVLKHKQESGSVVGYSGARDISNEELLQLEVDILIPAALEGAITVENAPGIRARMVAELANGPTTPQADEVLIKKGIHLIPDILCNGGGVIVSHLEMMQNFDHGQWEESDVNRLLDKKMVSAYDAVLKTAREHKINMRQAAYAVAVRRVVEAMRLRGWV